MPQNSAYPVQQEQAPAKDRGMKRALSGLWNKIGTPEAGETIAAALAAASFINAGLPEKALETANEFKARVTSRRAAAAFPRALKKARATAAPDETMAQTIARAEIAFQQSDESKLADPQTTSKLVEDAKNMAQLEMHELGQRQDKRVSDASLRMSEARFARLKPRETVAREQAAGLEKAELGVKADRRELETAESLAEVEERRQLERENLQVSGDVGRARIRQLEAEPTKKKLTPGQALAEEKGAVIARYKDVALDALVNKKLAHMTPAERKTQASFSVLMQAAQGQIRERDEAGNVRVDVGRIIEGLPLAAQKEIAGSPEWSLEIRRRAEQAYIGQSRNPIIGYAENLETGDWSPIHMNQILTQLAQLSEQLADPALDSVSAVDIKTKRDVLLQQVRMFEEEGIKPAESKDKK